MIEHRVTPRDVQKLGQLSERQSLVQDQVLVGHYHAAVGSNLITVLFERFHSGIPAIKNVCKIYLFIYLFQHIFIGESKKNQIV